MKKTIIILINIMFVLAFNPPQALAQESRKWGFAVVYNHSPMYTGAEELMARILSPRGSRELINLSDYGEFTTSIDRKGIMGLSLEYCESNLEALVRVTCVFGKKTEFRGYHIEDYAQESQYSIGTLMLSLEVQKGFFWNHNKTLVTGLGGGLNMYAIKLNEEHNNDSSVSGGLVPFLSISQKLRFMKDLWLEIGYKKSLTSLEHDFLVDSDHWSDSIKDDSKVVRGLKYEKDQFLIRLIWRLKD